MGQKQEGVGLKRGVKTFVGSLLSATNKIALV